MAGVFAKIGKWALIAGGSVLSAIGLSAIGAPLIVAGTAISTTTSGTTDVVSTYAANLQTGINTAGAMQSAGANVLSGNYILVWIQRNMAIVIIGVGLLIVLIFKPFKRKRR